MAQNYQVVRVSRLDKLGLFVVLLGMISGVAYNNLTSHIHTDALLNEQQARREQVWKEAAERQEKILQNQLLIMRAMQIPTTQNGAVP